LLVAAGWLLARTDAGRLEVRDADARFAASLLMAVPPAWLAWLAPGLARGATSGQRRAGLGVRGTLIARINRFALHPLALPLWIWVALVVFALGSPKFGVAVAFVAALVLLLAVASLVMWAASPGWRALHDRIGRTRLVSVARDSRS
jgi:hypothetical protein